MRLSFLALHTALLGLLLLGLPAAGHAGETAFTERGKIDFDTAMGLLNPYGTWSKATGTWAFTPLDHGAPYTLGRWLYTEFGWTWQGRRPHSWLTEHYGYWKRGADHVWAWYPGPYWLSETVEIRASADGIGWRSAEVDRDGNFVESPADRYTKTDEWTFVSPAQFAGPITPETVAQPQAAERLLEESTSSAHTYLTYRELDRPGPHPANFLTLGDGRMFAPMTPQERQLAQHPPSRPSLKSPVPAPALVGVNPEDAADTRQVKYWLTMSLPTFWTPPPPDARRNEIYLYRPDFYQDQDGIVRRIALWLDPRSRANEALRLQEALNRGHAIPGGSASSALPAVPAAPAVPVRKHDPFASPFDDSFQGGVSAPAARTPTPASPRSAAGAPIATNAAPSGR